MPLEAQRSRHLAIAVPTVAIADAVAIGAGHPCAQPEQPDIAYHYALCWSGVAGRFLGELHARSQAEFGVDVSEVGLQGAR